MKNLARFFFCTFVITLFYSCDPEEISSDSKNQAETSENTYMDTGNQEGDIIE